MHIKERVRYALPGKHRRLLRIRWKTAMLLKRDLQSVFRIDLLPNRLSAIELRVAAPKHNYADILRC